MDLYVCSWFVQLSKEKKTGREREIGKREERERAGKERETGNRNKKWGIMKENKRNKWIGLNVGEIKIDFGYLCYLMIFIDIGQNY